MTSIRFGGFHNIEFSRDAQTNLQVFNEAAIKRSLFQQGATTVLSNGHMNGVWYNVWAPEEKDNIIRDYFLGLGAHIQSYEVDEKPVKL